MSDQKFRDHVVQTLARIEERMEGLEALFGHRIHVLEWAGCVVAVALVGAFIAHILS